jgi:hypothetical protein
MTREEFNKPFFSSDNYYKNAEFLFLEPSKMTLTELYNYMERLDAEIDILYAEGKLTDFVISFTEMEKKEIASYMSLESLRQPRSMENVC